MMKETKLEKRDPTADLKNMLWGGLGFMRRRLINSGDYHFILFLLILQRDGMLNELKISSKDDLFSYKVLRNNNYRTHNKNLADRNNISHQKDNTENIKSLWKIYEPIISRISLEDIFEIVTLLRSLDQSLLREHFPEIFDDLIYKFSQSQGRYGGEFLLPNELSRFIHSLVELPTNARVYNPFAGLASFGVLLNQDQNYIGQENNKLIWAAGTLRIMAYERVSVSQFELEDSIYDWNPKAEKYDLIVSSPPILGRLPEHLAGQFGNIRTLEHFLIEKGIEDLKPNGKLIAVVSNGFLFRSGSEQNLRRFLVENDLLEMVITFPGGLLLNTGIPISILVVSKNKEEKGVVRFVDAKKSVQNLRHGDKRLNEYALNSVVSSTIETDGLRIVSNDTIGRYDFNLSVPRYFQKQVDGVPLGELVTFIRGQRNIEGLQGKFIRIRDLKDDKLNYRLNQNSIEQSEIPRPAQKISESCLLLATRWKTLKPTYFDFAGESIFVIPDTIALKVDETKIDLDYLVNELHSKYVADQLESYRVGEIIPSIRRDDLLNVKIHVPSIEKQRAEVKDALEKLAEEKKKELSFFKKIHGLESEIVEQNIYLRHTLAGPVSNLKGALSNIKKIIIEKVQPTVSGIMNLKVSDDHELNFAQYLEILERDVAKITDAVSRQLNVETNISSKKLAPVELMSFFKKFVSEYSDKIDLNFTIDFQIDEEAFVDEKGKIRKVSILANTELLTDLFNNLIENAVAHAFSVEGKHRIEIYLMGDLENKSDNEKITILFSNTGNPFPFSQNFSFSDFIRKGSKIGANEGDGFGGWYINEIIKQLNGEFDIIDETGPGGIVGTDLATSFEIEFPIFEMDEHEEI